MIEIRNVSLRLDGKSILNNISLTLEPGKIYGLVGSNGSGKTMLMKCICGFVHPTEGEIKTDGRRVGKDVDYLPNAGIIIETPGFIPYYSGLQNLRLLAGIRRKVTDDQIRKALKITGLDPDSRLWVRKYSLGMRQRLGIAQAIMEQPDILILDEPTSGLDPRTRFEFKEILSELQESGKTIVISSHVLSELSELCTDIGIIDQGRMVLEGNINDILSRVNTSNPLVISVFSNVDKALAILKSHPCVQTISLREQDICVRFSGDSQDEALLLQQLIDSDVLVNGFTREKGSLESVFMQLTEHEEERVVLSYDAESGF